MLRGPKPINRAISQTARQLFVIAAQQGISRKEMAAVLGVAQTTVHHWARGRSDIGASDAEALAKFLGFQLALQERKQESETNRHGI